MAITDAHNAHIAQNSRRLAVVREVRDVRVRVVMGSGG
jgi:hypothetical protein